MNELITFPEWKMSITGEDVEAIFMTVPSGYTLIKAKLPEVTIVSNMAAKS